MENKFSLLQQHVQLVIDLAGSKQYSEANQKLAEAGDMLDEILDFAEDDEDLIEVSRYQVLLNQLQQKINTPG